MPLEVLKLFGNDSTFNKVAINILEYQNIYKLKTINSDIIKNNLINILDNYIFTLYNKININDVDINYYLEHFVLNNNKKCKKIEFILKSFYSNI